MAGSPLFTIVDTDTGREIKLVDDTGAPCAVPMSQDWRDEDHRYTYTDGSVGRSPVIHRHEVALACDWLTDATRRNLVRLKANRAKVLFTPGWGERTALAWRPVEVDGTTLPSGATWHDLTGQVHLTNAGGGGQAVWDSWTHEVGEAVEPSGTAPALVVETPHGAGQAMMGATTNRWVPDYPASATGGFGAGNAGWEAGGLALADITFAHVSGGGISTDAPDALRVTTSNLVTASRMILAQDLWDSGSGDYAGYSFTGALILNVSFWVKGRFPAGNDAVLMAGATTLDSVDLDGVYDNWTKISLSGYQADWTGIVPSVRIGLNSANGERANFMVTAMSCAGKSFGALSRWTEAGGATTAECVASASMTKPQTGSVTVSFYVPPGANLAGLPNPFGAWLASLDSTATSGTLRLRADGTNTYLDFVYNTAGDRIRNTVSCGEGVHAASVMWGTSYLAVAYDGVMVYENTAATGKDFDWLADSAVSVGNSGYGAWPLIPLTFRLDADQHRSDIQHIHASLMDSVSLGTITAARGRQYEIRQIPSTPRMANGATYWIGNLVLSQVDYDSDGEDVTTKEV